MAFLRNLADSFMMNTKAKMFNFNGLLYIYCESCKIQVTKVATKRQFLVALATVIGPNFEPSLQTFYSFNKLLRKGRHTQYDTTSPCD